MRHFADLIGPIARLEPIGEHRANRMHGEVT
jgi:hypothetical protein